MTLRIRTIARLTGSREATLRAWERRYAAAALRSACAQVAPELVALSLVRRRGPEEMLELLKEAVRACSPVPVVVGGPGARAYLKAIFSVAAQYAEPADELMALWQQARGAPHRT